MPKGRLGTGRRGFTFKSLGKRAGGWPVSVRELPGAVCGEAFELEPAVTVHVPGVRFLPGRGVPRDRVFRELAELGSLYGRSGDAVGGLYKRICEHVRRYDVEPSEVRKALGGTFSGVRISEILRVCSAAEPLWFDYMAGEVSFRVVLLQTRLRRSVVRKSSVVRWRNCRRAAARMVRFLEGLGENDWTHRSRGWQVEVRRVNITNIVLSDLCRLRGA
jgi:hypothetical protein